jgi:rubredoxin
MLNTATVSGETPAPVIGADTAFKVWQCVLCGFIYDEAAGLPSDGIPPGTRWADVPEGWLCPDCSAAKSDFEMIEI